MKAQNKPIKIIRFSIGPNGGRNKQAIWMVVDPKNPAIKTDFSTRKEALAYIERGY